MKTKQTAVFILIAVLLAVIVWLILTRPDTEKPAIIKHETEIKQDTRRIDSLLLRQEELRLQLREDSLKSIEAKKAFKMRIATLEKKLAMVKTEVQPWLDSIPILKTYTDMQDSVISVQNSRIDSLETERSIERMKFKRLLLAGDEKFNAAIEINSHFKAIDDIRKKDNRRLKKVNQLLLVAVPVSFVGGVLLAK
jgi:DNA-directed RNA polymerase beta subunit